MGNKIKHGLTREKGLNINKKAGYMASRRLKRDRAFNKRAGLHDKKKDLQEGESRIYRCKPLAIKHKRRLRKVVMAFCAVLVAGLSYVGLGFLVTKENYGVEELNNATVCFETPADGSLPTEHTLVENVGYLNYVLQHKECWSSSMSSTVHTIMEQHVYTHKKKYEDKIISADMATGASNTARQFCVSDEYVLWREANGNIDINSMDSEWSDGKPYGHSIERFRRYRGLPPSEFSVYILNELTIKNAEEKTVTDNGDGTYTMKLDLKVHPSGLDSAVHYYKQQMLVTGGLYDWPTFDYTYVTYVFTADWTLLEFSISDKYSAKMGAISAGCTSDSRTVFDYNEQDAVNSYYNDYFKKYDNANGFIDPRPDMAPDPDAATCLSGAFGSVLTDGAVFKANFDISGRPLEGKVYVGIDSGNFNDLRVALGSLGVYLDGEGGKKSLYLNVGKDKLKVGLDAFTAGDAQAVAATEETQGGETESGEQPLLDLDALMEQIFGGEFKFDETSASLKSTIEVFGLKVNLDFEFLIDKEGAVSLNYVDANLNLNGSPVSARLKFGTEADIPAALSASEKTQYTDVLQDGITLGINAAIGSGNDKFALDGAVRIELSGGAFKGVSAVLGDKSIYYVAESGMLYMNLGENAAYKLDTSKLNLGGAASGLSQIDLGSLIPKIIGGLTTDGTGISFDSGNLFGQMLHLALNVNLSGKLGISANAELSGKEISAVIGLGGSVAIPEIGNIEKYVDLLNGEIDLNVNLSIDELTLEGVVGIVLNNGALKEVKVNLAGGGLAVYYDSAENTVYLSSGNDLKVKLDTTALNGASTPSVQSASAFDLKQILSQIIENLKGTQSGISTGLNLTLPENSLMGETQIKADVAVDILGGIGVKANAELFGKKVALGATLGGKAVPELTDAEKAGYCNIFGDVIALGGRLGVDVGGTLIDLNIDELTLKLTPVTADGATTIDFEFALKSQITVADTLIDIFVSYTEGKVTLVYGAGENQVGVCIDVAGGDLKALESALVDVYNRVAAVLDEIILNANIQPVETLGQIKLLDDILKKLGLGNSAAKGIDAILEMLGITGEGKTVDKILGALTFDAPNGGLIGLRAGNLALELIAAGENNPFALNVSLSDSSVNANVSVNSILKANAHASADCGNVLTAEDLTEMLDYLAATVELLVEKEYSLDVQTKIYEGADVALDVGVVFEYVQGDGFPVEVTLPEKDADGNEVSGLKVNFRDDMYFHLGVGLARNREVASNYTVDESGNKTYKDDLYLDVYIFDSDVDGVLDIYLWLSKYVNGTKNAEPLKIHVTLDEIMTILAAGVSMLDLNSLDISGQYTGDNEAVIFALNEIDKIIAKVAPLLDDILVKAYLGDVESQFTSLGNSLIKQILGDDLQTIISNVISGLFGNADKTLQNLSEELVPVETKVKSGNYINSLTVDQNTLQVVLNSDAIYGESYENIIFTASKTYSEEKGANIIEGATLKNVYYGNGNMLNLGLSLNRSVAQKTDSDFEKFTDFTGLDVLVKALVNSASHKTSEEEIAAGYTEEYKLNSDYYISGSATLDILSYKVEVTVDGLFVNIGDDNNVTINLTVSYPGVQELNQVVINGDSTLNLTIKDGMVYMHRTQYTHWVKNGLITSEISYDTPVVEYRVMSMSQFTESLMDQMYFMFNMGKALSGIINNSSGSDNNFKLTYADYGSYISNFISSYTYDASGWNITVNGTTLSGLAGISLSDIKVMFSAEDRGDSGVIINKLTASGSLYSVIKFSAELNYRNPQNVYDEGYSNNTVDLSSAALDELSGYSWTEVLTGMSYNKMKAALAEYNADEANPDKKTVFDYIAAHTDWTALTEHLGISYLRFCDGVELKFGTLKFEKETEEEYVYEQSASAMPVLYYGDTIYTYVKLPEIEWNMQYELLQQDGTLTYRASYIRQTVTLKNDTYGLSYDYKYILGTTVTLPEAPTTAYIIDGYYKDAAFGGEQISELYIEGDTVLYIKCSPKPVTVTYVSGVQFDGSVANADGKYVYEATYSGAFDLITSPVVENYQLLGWWHNSGSGYTYFKGGDDVYALGEENVTLEAVWVRITSNVTGTRWDKNIVSTKYKFKIEGEVYCEFVGSTEIVQQYEFSESTVYAYLKDNGVYQTYAEADKTKFTETYNALPDNGKIAFSFETPNRVDKQNQWNVVASFTFTCGDERITVGGNQYAHNHNSWLNG